MTIANQASALIALYQWWLNPTTGPDAAIRTKLSKFRRAYITSTGDKGGNMEEGERLLLEAAQREGWPEPPGALARRWHEMFLMPDRSPPPLSPPAQLIWLGIEMQCDDQVVRSALVELFRDELDDISEAYREAAEFFKVEARSAGLRAAVFRAWHDFHKASGRPESELRFGNCVDELGIVENRDGRQVLNFNNLQRVADPELRRVTLAAAWKAHEEDQPAQGRRQ